MVKIEQEKFYHIRYANGTSDSIKTTITLKSGRYYKTKDGIEFQVLKQSHYKYTYEEIEAIKWLTEGYDIGTLQHKLSKKMNRALHSKTPSVRFTSDEREILSYIYYENESLTENDKRVLEKIIGVRRENGKTIENKNGIV